MSYLVLARKWRPKTFDEVVGQTTVIRTLKNALASGRVGHAFLLSGARGVGKTTTARILAKALNCSKGDGPTAEPCGECSSCLEIATGTSLDVQEIDGATHNGVEQVRELRESARYNPARDRYKVWIIDEVHMLSTGAFNALLKTLEEPPPRVKFIFATTEYHKIPDTILSRCQQYEFRLIPARELVAHLREVASGEAIVVSDDGLSRIARAAEGSARDALSLFDQVLSFSGNEVRDEDITALLGLIDRELLLSVSRAVVEGDSLATLDVVESLSDHGADHRNFARELILHFREILLLKLAPPDSALLAHVVPEERERLRPLAGAFSEDDLLRTLDVLAKLETDLRLATDPRVMLELALLKLVQMRRLLPFAVLVERVEKLVAGLPAGPVAQAALPVAGPRRLPSGPPTAAAVALPVPTSAAPGPAPGPAAAPPAIPEPAPQAAQPAAIRTPQPVEKPPASPPTPSVTEKPPAPADPEVLLSGMIAQARPSVAPALRASRAHREDDTLVIEVPPDFLTFASLHESEFKELAKKAAGRAVKVRIQAGSAAPASAEAPPPPRLDEAKREKLMAEAAREPAVQEALDLFNGKVVDVREAKS